MGTILYLATALGIVLTVTVFVMLLRHDRLLVADRRLKALERPADLSGFPSVTIIVPARNEARNIGPCLDALLELDYPHHRIIVANDGSTDQTVQLAEAAADRAATGRVQVIHLEEQAEERAGWVSGKSYVLWQASQQAEGELILFVDADTRLHPDALWRAVCFLQEADLPALSCSGVYQNPTFVGDLLESFLYLPVFLAVPLKAVHDPQSPLGWMNGQFILFRREAYAGIGGHRAIKQYSFDDMSMAATLKREGVRFRFCPGAELFHCVNYLGFKEAWRGWVRLLAGGTPWLGLGGGYFALSMVVIGLTAVLPFLVLPLALVEVVGHPGWAGLPLWLLSAVQCGLAAGLMLLYRSALHTPVWRAVFTPVAALLTLTVYLAGLWMRYVRGGFDFRGRLVTADPGRGA